MNKAISSGFFKKRDKANLDCVHKAKKLKLKIESQCRPNQFLVVIKFVRL